MTLGPYPPFSWSYSRHKTLSACARRYYYHYYGSWEGWEASAGETARRAYLLKNLTNLHLVLGNALHRRAFELLMKAQAGRELPPLEELRDKTRDELNRAWAASHDREAFHRDPKGRPMLWSFWYEDGPAVETLQKIRDKAAACLRNLHGRELWEAVRDRRVKAEFVDDPDVFTDPTVEVDGTEVYATPDLVVRTEDGTRVVVDWKTGREGDEDRWQLSVYGLFVRQRFGDAESVGRLVYLQDGSVKEHRLTEDRLDETVRRVRKSLRDMRRRLEDPELNRPEPRESFELAEDRWECRGCNFFELCEEELRATGGVPWEE